MRLLCFALLSIFSPTPQHVRGTAEPLLPPTANLAPGLTVELRPRDGQTSFRLYESIPLEARASEAGFGVQYGYVASWLNVLTQRDSPELFSSLRPEDTGPAPDDRRRAFAKSGELVLESLNRAIAQKTGLPLEMTVEAIRILRRDIAAASK